MKSMFRPLCLRVLTFCAALVCASFVRAAEEAKPDPGPAPSADETKAVDELAKHGVHAEPLANGLHWLYVNFRGADKADSSLYAPP